MPAGNASRDAVDLYGGVGKILDASCAFRVATGWVYGLPELDGKQKQAIAEAPRVSNPGCYALASVLAIRPLIFNGLLDAALPLAIHSLSGYSGGGAAMIEEFESGGTVRLTPRPYALTRRHKHLDEICRYVGLAHEPVFIPSVAGFKQGLRVWIPLHRALLKSERPYEDVLHVLARQYTWEARVRVQGHHGPAEMASLELEPTLAAGSDRIWLHVIRQSPGHILLVAILDNLGKGAAGTAEQNIELMLGLSATAGRQVRSASGAERNPRQAAVADC